MRPCSCGAPTSVYGGFVACRSCARDACGDLPQADTSHIPHFGPIALDAAVDRAIEERASRPYVPGEREEAEREDAEERLAIQNEGA